MALTKKAALIEHRPLVSISIVSPLVRHDLPPDLPQCFRNWVHSPLHLASAINSRTAS